MTFSAEFGSGFRATLTVSSGGMECAWSPSTPRNLPPKERDALLETYRIWRDSCMRQFATVHGLTVKTILLDGLDCLVFVRKEAA